MKKKHTSPILVLSFLVFLGLSFLGFLAHSFLGFLPPLLELLAVLLHTQANFLVCVHRVCLQKNIARLAMKPKVPVVAFLQGDDHVFGLSVIYNSAEKLASARPPFPRYLECIHIIVDAMEMVAREFLVVAALVAAVVAALVAALVAVLVAGGVAVDRALVVAAAAVVGGFCLRHGGGCDEKGLLEIVWKMSVVFWRWGWCFGRWLVVGAYLKKRFF